MSNPVEVAYVDKRWRVATQSKGLVLGTYRYKIVAEAVARAFARYLGAELIIKGRDGRIQRRDSHGHDPRDVAG